MTSKTTSKTANKTTNKTTNNATNKTINLNYNLSNWSLTATDTSSPDGAQNPPSSTSSTGNTKASGAATATKREPAQQSKIQAARGEKLTWESNTPGVTDFFVYLEPAGAFEPNVFSKDSNKPVVVGNLKGKGHAWCGFVSGGKLYGYPIDKNYGHSIDP